MFHPIAKAKAHVQTAVKADVKGHFVEHKNTYAIAATGVFFGLLAGRSLSRTVVNPTVNVHVHTTPHNSDI